MIEITKAETALLGLLTESPMYPYQIEKEVEFREMRLWTELSMSSIYKTLKKLEEKKLVERKNQISRENRVQKLYSISKKGNEMLRKVLMEMISKPEHMVWQIDLATYNLDVLPRNDVIKALKEYRINLEEKINWYKGVYKCLDDLECPDYRFAISTRPQFLLKGEIEWMDSYIKQLEELDMDVWEAKAKDYLFKLCSFQPHRRLGSPGNKMAISYFQEKVRNLGFDILTDEFDCIDHEIRQVSLTTGDTRINVLASPYTLPVDVTAELVVARNIEELEEADFTDKILLMKDDLCKEQLMPKNFVFYNPVHHRKVYSIIEEKRPAAIITATGKDLQMVGNIYPFNIFEDGDFDIPSVYTKDIIGDELEKMDGKDFILKIDANRIRSTGYNIILSRNPDAEKKIVFMAHIDTKDGTPGASDNASGTVVLLLLAELLKDFDPPDKLGIEIIAMNGEDNYSVAGEMDYLRRFKDQFPRIRMVINIDDVGHGDGRSSFSFYNVPDDIKEIVTAVINDNDTTIEGEPWYAGDHMIFVQSEIPAVAITSEDCWDLMATITHTPDDIPENITPSTLVELSQVLRDLIFEFSNA